MGRISDRFAALRAKGFDVDVVEDATGITLYADLPGGGNYRRSVAVDRVYFNADGSIKPIVRTAK